MPTTGIEGIVLAAGLSFRASTFKPGLLLAGKPLIYHTLTGMLAVCERVVVVGGYCHDQLRLLLASFGRVDLVENLNYGRGMFTSIKVGVSHATTDRVFVLPADIPLVPRSVYGTLLNSDARVAVPTIHGRGGHPVLLRRETFPTILAEPDSSSLRQVIERLGFSRVAVDAEEILLDVDTPQDLERLEARLGRTVGGQGD